MTKETERGRQRETERKTEKRQTEKRQTEKDCEGDREEGDREEGDREARPAAVPLRRFEGHFAPVSFESLCI